MFHGVEKYPGRDSAAGCGHEKRAAGGPLFVSSHGKDYLLILRRMTMAKAPRPRRPIVAGSGIGAVANVAV